MFEKLIALDIGTTSVKLLCTRRSLKKTEIVTYSFAQLDPDSENRVQDVTETVKSLLDDVPKDNYRIVTSYPMESVIVRRLTFPFLEVSKIREVLPFETEELLPFSLDEAKLDFQLLSQDGGSASVLAAALPDTQFSDYSSILDGTQWPVGRIGLEANALYSYLHDTPSVPDSYIQCDIGYAKSIMTVVVHKKLAASRCIPIGLGQLIEQISVWLKLSIKEASEVFEHLHFDMSSLDANYDSGFYKSLKIPKKRLADIYNEADDIFTEICTQIAVTAESVREESGGTAFDRLYLSGGGASLLRIGDYFEGKTAIPVSRPPGIPGLSDPTVQNRFAICYGMIQDYTHAPGSIDFLHDKLSSADRSFDLSRFYPAIFFGSLSMIVFIAAVLLNLVFGIRAEAIRHDTLAEQYNTLFKEKLPEGADPMEEARKLLQTERTELTAITNILPTADTVMTLLATLTDQFPSDDTFVLENITITEQSITVRGESENSANLDTFKNRLSELPQFESVNLNTSASSGNTVKFTLIIKQKQSKEDTENE
ncbi:MAG: pilus assembly protein PilM [Spirochaetota bacterium]